jgi:phage baseplate assembly protein gpV
MSCAMDNMREAQNSNERRMSGVIGMGKVVEVDLDAYTARVQDGEITTGWLRMGTPRAAGSTMTWPYEEGEEVGFATIDGDMEDGFIFCALGNGGKPAKGTKGVLSANASGGFDLTGDITLKGKLTATGDVIAGKISLQNHRHEGVVPGPAKTGGPA